MTDPEHKLRWYQYSLSSLFILTTLVALACGWYSWYAAERRKTAKIRAAIAEIRKLGGRAFYGYNKQVDGFCLTVQTTDAGMVHLKGLTELKELWFDASQITDAGLVHLEDLTKLKWLWFWNTQVTDAGLVHLRGLTKLEVLSLGGTQITDAGLVHLEGLTELKVLHLWDTQITDEGVEKLQQALPNCTIYHRRKPGAERAQRNSP